MSPEQLVDDEPGASAGQGGIVQTYSLALVCALGLIVGGAAAFALSHARRGPVEVRGVAGKNPAVGYDSGAEAAVVESRAAEGARAKDVEAREVGGEAADDLDGGTVASTARVGRPRAGLRVRAEAGPSSGDGSRAARRDARPPLRQAAGGGRSLGGHALGGVKKTGAGVKKTGAAIGKTVGKIGGIFHD